jgi:hypothetical protein
MQAGPAKANQEAYPTPNGVAAAPSCHPLVTIVRGDRPRLDQVVGPRDRFVTADIES